MQDYFILKIPIYAYYYTMSNIDNILRCFPLRLREFMQKNISSDELEVLEEIRIRNNKNVILNLGLKEKNSKLCSNARRNGVYI